MPRFGGWIGFTPLVQPVELLGELSLRVFTIFIFFHFLTEASRVFDAEEFIFPWFSRCVFFFQGSPIRIDCENW